MVQVKPSACIRNRQATASFAGASAGNAAIHVVNAEHPAARFDSDRVNAGKKHVRDEVC